MQESGQGEVSLYGCRGCLKLPKGWVRWILFVIYEVELFFDIPIKYILIPFKLFPLFLLSRKVKVFALLYYY